MFDFGLGSFELMIIAIVAIIVVGPKDLPKLLRSVGQVMTKIRGLAREFQGYIDEAARESGLDDVKKEVNKMTNFTVTDPSTKPGTPKPAANSDSDKMSGTPAVAKSPQDKPSEPAAKSGTAKPADPGTTSEAPPAKAKAAPAKKASAKTSKAEA